MSQIIGPVYEFGPFRLDAGERLLFQKGEGVQLPPKAIDLLLLLVENSGHLLEKEELIHKLWPDSFVEEANLSHHIFSLRRALSTGSNGLPYIETVPRRGYRFIGPVKEWDGGGIHEAPDVDFTSRSALVNKRNAEKQSQPSVSEAVAVEAAAYGTALTRRPRRLTKKGMLAALLVIAGVIIGIAFLRPGRHAQEAKALQAVRSIAVLPFRTIDLESNDEYLGLAMADALITRLSGLDQIIVRPTSAVTDYKDKGQDPVATGRKLRVDAVLEGSIQKLGDRIRLTVQLVAMRDARPLWAGKFDEKATDLFALEDSVSEAVARSLLHKLTAEQEKQLFRRYTDDVEAYKLYVRGQHLMGTMDGENLKKARQYFEQAIERDSNFAAAYAWLGATYSCDDSVPRNVWRPKAIELLSKALRIDETLAEAHFNLAVIKIFSDLDWPGAEMEIQRSMQLQPNYSWGHLIYARYWQVLGRLDKATAEIEKAQELDPLSFKFIVSGGDILISARQYGRAVEELRMALDIDPSSQYAHELIARAYELEGMYEKAVASWQKSLSLSGEKELSETLNKVYHRQGYEKAKRAVLENRLHLLEEKSEREYVPARDFAYVWAGLGHRDQTLKWLEKAYEQRSVGLAGISTDPEFDNLRSNPRFLALLKKMGLPSEIVLPQ